MQHLTSLVLRLTVIALAAVVLFPAGCDSAPKNEHAQTAPQPDDAATQRTRLEAQRLAEALAKSNASVAVPPEVRWLEPGQKIAPADTPLPASTSARPATDVMAPSLVIDAANALTQGLQNTGDVQRVPTAHATAPAIDPADRNELAAALLKQVLSSSSSNARKAVEMVGLSLLDTDGKLNERALEPLDSEQRQAVRRLHEVMLGLGRIVASGDALDLDAANAQVEQVFGEQPLRIRQAELCRSVRGYGVYEPFEERTLIAGRENAMIVYAEVDRFRVEPIANQRFRVKLQQETVLYNQADGLAVWRESPVEIIDESRNRRRDFFVVQLIRLPANLPVGKYLLKLSITDHQSESVDEMSLPLNVVADKALVGSGRETGLGG